MQQFLTNLLPGLRDARAPLAAGYLWLVAVWLLVGDRIPAAGSATGRLKALYELGELLGPISAVVAVSFGAYLLGAVSQSMLDWFLGKTALLGYGYWRAKDGFVNRSSFKRLERFVRHRVGDELGRLRGSGVDALEFVKARYGSGTASGLDVPPRYRSAIDDEEATAEMGLWYALFQDVVLNLQLVEGRLIKESPELYGRIDRLKSESELRLAITPPLAMIAVILALGSSWWYLLSAGGLAILFGSGLQRRSEAGDSLADAILAGEVEPPALQDLRDAVDKVGAVTAQQRADAKERGYTDKSLESRAASV